MKASSLRELLLTHPSKYITKESPVTTLRDNSSASLWSTPPFLTPHQITLQDGMTDQSHLCQPGLFIARKLPQIAKQQTNIIYYHMGQLSTASACSHFFLHSLPLPTQSTFISFFFSLEEPLFFIFILEPLVFRCSKCCNIFSPQIKCEVLTSSKKIKHTRRILLSVPSWHQKATTLRTAEDAMFVCCGSLWVIVSSSYLFRFLEVWETAKNEPQKNRSTAQVDSISLTIYHLHFLGCAFFTNCYFWDIKHILQFMSTRFPFRQFKMVKLSNQIFKKNC